MWLGVDPFAELRVVAYGDAETVAGNPAESHAQMRRRVSEICAAGAIPIVLGGDHSVAHPNMAAVAEHHGKRAVGVIHFDAHADTAADLRGIARSHGTPMRLVVDEGWVRGDRFIQAGLRGSWPGPEEFGWMRKVGFHWYTMYELDERGFDVCARAPARRRSAGSRCESSCAARAGSPPSCPSQASRWWRSLRPTTPPESPP
jgi:agmatinase